MPKGRQFAPCTNGDGIWFSHRGLPDEGPMLRGTSTSTGVMLNAPMDPIKAQYPPVPPQEYRSRDAANFKTSNNFSAHDNRHSLQDHGVYFGDGKDTRHLGKRLTAPVKRQHYTDKDIFKHNGREVCNYDYNSVYSSNYHGNQQTEKPSCRRFPKIHKDGSPGLSKLDTTTTDWHKSPELPYKTPLHVLAITQEPFLGHNKWKYSNHGLAKCYPPYDKVNPKKPYPIWMVQGPKAEQGVE